MSSRWYPVLVLVLALQACGSEEPADSGGTRPSPSSAVAALVLPGRPADPITVQAAKAKGPADKVAVTGRVASIVPGFVVFSLMDLSLPYCGQTNKEDGCKTPWDYCCESTQTRSANTLLVEVRGADGKPLAASALPELRLLDQVTVAGRILKDDHGNHVLLATGWHRDERPQVPADIRWPGSK